MVVVRGIAHCSCYELEDREKRLLVEVDLPGGKREEFTLEKEKVQFFIHPKALSG